MKTRLLRRLRRKAKRKIKVFSESGYYHYNIYIGNKRKLKQAVYMGSLSDLREYLNRLVPTLYDERRKYILREVYNMKGLKSWNEHIRVLNTLKKL